MAGVIERAPFGRTGHLSSRVVFGAAALAHVDQERADRLLPLLLEHGINHIDTAADYGDAELRLAPWLREHPDSFFVATKTAARDADGARASLERSLVRMGLEQVDLIQLHNLVDPEEWRAAHEPGGALEALVQARDEGLVRHIGVTGHGVSVARMHLQSLRQFDYDSVLVPYSFTMMELAGYRADVEALLAVCAEREVAVQTIKAIAKGQWEPGAATTGRQSWYEPLTDEQGISRAVGYVLARPRLFLASPSALDQLPLVLAAAQDLAAPDPEALREDVVRLGITPLFDEAPAT
jgi:aryl-alcohol dehydrogenase-like predicted oxidoreductase